MGTMKISASFPHAMGWTPLLATKHVGCR